MIQNFLKTFFFYFFTAGIVQVLLFTAGKVGPQGIFDAILVSFLWLIPSLLFPKQQKRINLFIGISIFILNLPSFGYFLIYQEEITQSLYFIIFDSNSNESSEYIQHYFKWWIPFAFFAYGYISYKLWTLLKPIELTNKKKYTFSFLILFIIFINPIINKGFLTPGFYKTLRKHLEPTSPWQLFIGYYAYEKHLMEMQEYLHTMQNVPQLQNLRETPKSKPTTVVLVIGESTNRYHMGLYGYHRNTTPNLSAMKDELFIFDNIFASRPNTIESLEQVLSFADENNPNLYKTQQSLLGLMKQAGYKIYWISNQQTLTGRNTMLTSFSQLADEQIYLNNTRRQNSFSFDEKVLEPYEKIIDTEQADKKLIIVHLLGTHMSYKYRYPDNFKQFDSKDDIQRDLSDEKKETINHYDNAVLYNDFIVSSLLKKLKAANQESLLIYFSDHGDDVYDSPPYNTLGRIESAPTVPMYAIPFILWTSDQWKIHEKLKKNSNFMHRKFTNANFIYAWSDLLGITYNEFIPEKSLFNDAFKESQILVGDPYIKGQVKELEIININPN